MSPVIPVQVTRQQLPQYQAYRPPVPDFMAMGMHVPWLINDSLVINDRLRYDRYVIDTISGLQGADIRDSRQVRPGDHGEVAYDAYWGGKTVTVSGVMEASTYAELSNMERDLRAQLTQLVEYPIKLNWWDQHDPFFDTQNIAYWSTLSGNALVIPGNGSCTTAGNVATLSYWNTRNNYVDVNVTAMVSVTPAGTSNSMGVAARLTSNTNYLYAQISWNATTNGWTLGLYAVDSAGTSLLSSVVLPQINFATYLWVQLQTLGDQITANVFTVDPHDVPGIPPAYTTSYVLSGATSDALGYGVGGYAGIICGGTVNWQFLDWRVEGIWPCDFEFNARAITNPSFSEQAQTDTDKFRKNFQFSVRASDPRMLCATTLQVGVPFEDDTSVLLARTYPHVFEQVYNVPIKEPAGTLLSQAINPANSVSIFNRGDWICKPVLTIYGGIDSPAVVNQTTGTQLALNCVITPGDYIVVDCAAHSISDSDGNDIFGVYSVNNLEWLTLVPGPNVMQLQGQLYDTAPYMIVSYQYAWSV
jgi:phage-related protein